MKPAQVVEAVDTWLAENEGATRSAAFAALTERTGRTPGAVSQSYYAAARRARGGVRPKRRSAPDAARLSAKPSTAIRSLSEYIAGLEREVKELREFRASVLAMLAP